MPRILHALSQRPSLTGSGVTLEQLVGRAARCGWEQGAVVGVPLDDARPRVEPLPPTQVWPLVFGRPPLDFPLPGMSDVMPYPSSRFAALDVAQILCYRREWIAHLTQVVREFAPDIIHAHHLWLLGALIKDVAPRTPVVSHCHGTGLRQMELCPHLAADVRAGVRRNERFLALHRGQAEAITRQLHVTADRVRVVGAGFDEQTFTLGDGRHSRGHRVLFVGKLSAAKGLPSLLDAVERLEQEYSHLELHVAGGGAGEEAESLTRRMRAMQPRVQLHGQLDPARLAALMRRCAVCVLPSFYEGLPLVLVEAFACGCRLVATRLPGVEEQLAPVLGSDLELVDLPRMVGIDTPAVEELPEFVERLARGLSAALERAETAPDARLACAKATAFGWDRVFERVEGVWNELL